METIKGKIVSIGIPITEKGLGMPACISDHDETKRLILEGVIDEFNLNGLKFTMDDLAKRLSMSKKTFYKYYRDKNELFLEMVDYCFSAIKESENRIFEDKSLSLVEKIKRIIVVLPERYSGIDFRKLWELKALYPEVFAKVASRIENDWEPTIKLLEEGVRMGNIRTVQIPVLKMMVESSIEHFLSGHTLLDENISYEQALEGMMDILLHGILADTEGDVKNET